MPGVADRSSWTGLDKQGVVVAVGENLHHVEEVAAFFALGPQLVARAAIECHQLGVQRLLVGFLVHEAQHQHFLCHRILDDGRDEAVHFLKIQIHFHCFRGGQVCLPQPDIV